MEQFFIQINETPFLKSLNDTMGQIAGFVWDWPFAVMLMLVGVILTISLGVPQIKGFVHAIKVIMGRYDDKNDPGEINHFQALCTALSATVGLGNIAGVAIAVHKGGPGATFWMIMCGLIGMATKFSECSLAVMHRKIDENGVVHGGPMYYIKLALAEPSKNPMAKKFWSFLAGFFAIACIASSFGASNMFQTNQVAAIIKSSFGIDGYITGIVLFVLTAIVILGGIKRIAKVTEFLVPFMAVIYFIACFIVIFAEFERIPAMIGLIFQGAFSGIAVEGAVYGIAVKEAFTWGVRRACFSNEAGLGSAAIAHSAVATKEPIREGVVALLEPFIDTVVICTLTALVVTLSGVWTHEVSGVQLTAEAFDTAIPGFGKYFLPIAVFLFAYSTLISWSYYGERAIVYLFGEGGLMPYRVIFCCLAFIGSVGTIDLILNFSDVMLAFMAVPNLIAVLFLLPKLKLASDEYFRKLKTGVFKENK